MDEVATVMAKLAGIRKAVAALLDETARDNMPRRNYPADLIGHQFKQAAGLVDQLRRLMPALYGDFQPMQSDPTVSMMSPGGNVPTPNHYARHQLDQLRRDIDQIFEVRANSELSQPTRQSAPELIRGSYPTDGRPSGGKFKHILKRISALRRWNWLKSRAWGKR